ncbi:MAG: hypothetical protein U5K54_11355 [Cytophagales bacterium]|nr:hypothetical protein [Cytophagales bacterium]
MKRIILVVLVMVTGVAFSQNKKPIVASDLMKIRHYEPNPDFTRWIGRPLWLLIVKK